jgi:hypothetical protein
LASATILGVLALLAWPRTVHGQAIQEHTSTSFGIVDNSFLVEEAFNQEPDVFQNIFTWTRGGGDGWVASFTQEWPLPGRQHQFSYTVPFSNAGATAGLSDTFINYRYQAWSESGRRPAIAPRVSLILPTGGHSGPGLGVYGLQVNVPVSKRFGQFYVHGNAGWTWSHAVPLGSAAGSEAVNLTSPLFAGSAIWQPAPLFDLMVESLVLVSEEVGVSGVRTRTVTTVSPGFRIAWNLAGERQLVLGAAVPFNRSEGSTDVAVLGYFSYELRFR